MMRLLLPVLLLFLIPCGRADDWGPLQFLVGHWTAEGGGKPGAGTGEFSFTPEVQNHVLVRRSFAQYPGSRHDDLMIIYRQSGSLEAMFFDSENHVIHYRVAAVAGGAQFLSDGAPSETRFRLTYTAAGANRLTLLFE